MEWIYTMRERNLRVTYKSVASEAKSIYADVGEKTFNFYNFLVIKYKTLVIRGTKGSRWVRDSISKY